MPPIPTTVRVTICGLGLIGGSMAAALRAAGGWYVSGYDADRRTAARALQRGFVDHLADSLDEACDGADFIVLATPVSVILADLDRLASLARDGATIIDVGSTKQSVHDKMNALPERLRAIGGHPMAGRRTAGVAGANASLFHGRKFVLVANDRTDDHALALARRAVNDIGAVEVRLEAARHDRLVALISHVPHYLAVGLLGATRGDGDDMAWQLAAGGFRAATSMASDNVAMWRDIGTSNGAHIGAGLRALADELVRLAELLEDGDRDAIGAVLADAADLYAQRLG